MLSPFDGPVPDARVDHGFSSRHFYDDRWLPTRRSEHIVFAICPMSSRLPLTSRPIEFIDTAGAEFDEQLEADGESKLNPKEANLIVRLVRELMDAGIAAEQIAVIAPYAAQVRLLRGRLELSGLEIDTVDGFQGREKEAVLLTMVRSNDRGEIGFLADTRRTNVAMTRARRKLIVVGDSATLGITSSTHPCSSTSRSAGGYRSVWELGRRFDPSPRHA